MVLDSLTKIGKIGLLLLIIGAVFFLVGFSVPYWMSIASTDYGLWEYCVGSICGGKIVRAKGNELGNKDWYRGTQALACLALIALIVTVVLLLLFVCGKPKKFLLIAIVLDIAAAAFAILAAVVFGSEADKYLGVSLNWGFAFDIIGGIFFGVSAALFLVEYCRH
ncbi:hypothetical protein BaRGS_00024710 [Batillaria attramentaria]|uniref:Uncharacterized protein n=1 Tax=Batillaria attramentaria TaxID=370345 RepID=A0ABD0KAI3_9CAEN